MIGNWKKEEKRKGEDNLNLNYSNRFETMITF